MRVVSALVSGRNYLSTVRIYLNWMLQLQAPLRAKPLRHCDGTTHSHCITLKPTTSLTKYGVVAYASVQWKHFGLGQGCLGGMVYATLNLLEWSPAEISVLETIRNKWNHIRKFPREHRGTIWWKTWSSCIHRAPASSQSSISSHW